MPASLCRSSAVEQATKGDADDGKGNPHQRSSGKKIRPASLCPPDQAGGLAKVAAPPQMQTIPTRADDRAGWCGRGAADEEAVGASALRMLQALLRGEPAATPTAALLAMMEADELLWRARGAQSPPSAGESSWVEVSGHDNAQRSLTLLWERVVVKHPELFRNPLPALRRWAAPGDGEGSTVLTTTATQSPGSPDAPSGTDCERAQAAERAQASLLRLLRAFDTPAPPGGDGARSGAAGEEVQCVILDGLATLAAEVGCEDWARQPEDWVCTPGEGLTGAEEISLIIAPPSCAEGFAAMVLASEQAAPQEDLATLSRRELQGVAMEHRMRHQKMALAVDSVNTFLPGESGAAGLEWRVRANATSKAIVEGLQAAAAQRRADAGRLRACLAAMAQARADVVAPQRRVSDALLALQQFVGHVLGATHPQPLVCALWAHYPTGPLRTAGGDTAGDAQTAAPRPDYGPGGGAQRLRAAFAAVLLAVSRGGKMRHALLSAAFPTLAISRSAASTFADSCARVFSAQRLGDSRLRWAKDRSAGIWVRMNTAKLPAHLRLFDNPFGALRIAQVQTLHDAGIPAGGGDDAPEEEGGAAQLKASPPYAVAVALHFLPPHPESCPEAEAFWLDAACKALRLNANDFLELGVQIDARPASVLTPSHHPLAATHWLLPLHSAGGGGKSAHKWPDNILEDWTDTGLRPHWLASSGRGKEGTSMLLCATTDSEPIRFVLAQVRSPLLSPPGAVPFRLRRKADVTSCGSHACPTRTRAAGVWAELRHAGRARAWGAALSERGWHPQGKSCTQPARGSRDAEDELRRRRHDAPLQRPQPVACAARRGVSVVRYPGCLLACGAGPGQPPGRRAPGGDVARKGAAQPLRGCG